jgi:hypothetical protein
MQTARTGAQTKRQGVAEAGEDVASRQNLTGRSSSPHAPGYSSPKEARYEVAAWSPDHATSMLSAIRDFN